jgi:hypothetical protein
MIVESGAEQISVFRKACKCQWIIVGDWNLEPVTFGQSVGPRFLEGELLLPEAEFACSAGRGRVIDFGIGSQQLRPLCSGRLDENSPWSTNDGLWLTIANVQEVSVLRQALARPILQVQGPWSRSWDDFAAHALTKGEEGAQDPPTSFVVEGEMIAYLVLVMQHRVTGWQKTRGMNPSPWIRPGWMGPLRRAANEQADELDRFIWRQVTEECRAALAKTALVLDQWAPREWAGLPDAALGSLTDILNEGENDLAWPCQSLAVIMGILGKSDGGERAIGLTGGLYCLWSRLPKPLVQAWDADRSEEAFWGKEAKGNSALLAGFVRESKSEVTNAMGLEAAEVLFDEAKFFDTLVPVLVGKFALVQKFCAALVPRRAGAPGREILQGAWLARPGRGSGLRLPGQSGLCPAQGYRRRGPQLAQAQKAPVPPVLPGWRDLGEGPLGQVGEAGPRRHLPNRQGRPSSEPWLQAVCSRASWLGRCRPSLWPCLLEAASGHCGLRRPVPSWGHPLPLFAVVGMAGLQPAGGGRSGGNMFPGDRPFSAALAGGCRSGVNLVPQRQAA